MSNSAAAIKQPLLSGVTLNACLIGASLLALFLACLIGTTPMAPARVFAALFGASDAVDATIIWSIRLPRALAAYLVGAALGASGAALQGLLRNPLAEPGVLGVSAAGALGASISLYYGVASLWAPALPLAAIAGALLSTGLLTMVAIRTRSVTTLILTGVGLSSFAGAIMALMMNLAPNPFSLSDMVNWMLGSVANRSLDDIALSAPFMAAGLAILLTHRRGLSLLTLGEEAASGAGLDLQRQRLAVVVGAGLATGASVALAGAIGFVGIVSPHLVRPLVRHDPSRSLLPSAMLAGVILVAADCLIRIMPTASELRLGVVAALIGAPVFIWIAMQKRLGA